jgi:RNA polymerase sigma-70 factor (ECF subfamily)
LSKEIPPAISSLDDDQLLRDTLAGRSEAFGELVHKHQPPLFDLAMRMLRNREDAEDVVQHVFMEAYRHLADFRHGSQFSTWLYSIALNRARNHLRSRKTRQAVTIDGNPNGHDEQAPLQLPDTSPSQDVLVEKQFELEWIQKEVKTLPGDYQTVFTLHYFQNLPLQEVATRLNRPLGTVKVYLHRARKELYQRFSKLKEKPS